MCSGGGRSSRKLDFQIGVIVIKHGIGYIVIKPTLHHIYRLKVKIAGFLFLILLLIPPSYGDPTYKTIQDVVQVIESKDIEGKNISGLVTKPEPTSKDPIKVFSTAEGKVTEIKNNDVIVLKNKDMSVNISGFIDGAERGKKANLTILRPDDSIYNTWAYLNKDGSYMIPTKLHTKWVEGIYEILVNYMGSDEGKIKFCVTDKESAGGSCGQISDQPEKLPQISKYLHGDITKEDLVSYLQEIHWAKYRIDNFLANNTPVYVNPYTFYYLLGLLPLLYILVSVLSKGKNRKVQQ